MKNYYGALLTVLDSFTLLRDVSYISLINVNRILLSFSYSSKIIINVIRILLERFSLECSKTKTKVVTLTTHNSRNQSNKPIKAQSKYM